MGYGKHNDGPSAGRCAGGAERDRSSTRVHKERADPANSAGVAGEPESGGKGERMKGNKKSAIVSEVDKTVKSICKRVQKRDMLPEYYAETVKALASLVEARAHMHK